jgi:hypothetical protein
MASTGRSARSFRRDYGLSIVITVMLIVTFVLHAAFGWWDYVAEQAQHGSEATVWGPDGYVVYFGEWTFQNWQSEFLVVLVMILLTVSLIHKGSHESRDGEDEMRERISRIEKRVEALADKR